jgi:hypothetical protein
MKLSAMLLISILIISVSLPLIYIYYRTRDATVTDEFYFGVSFGQNTAAEAKLLIDKVKGYTNMFLINSWNITTNETALTEVSDYAVKANLKFMVFFDYISRIIYHWHQTWLDTAKEKYGDKFLGVYLQDELGGKQIDTKEAFAYASDYGDAANRFVNSIASYNSTIDAKNKNIPIFTSDYALYWFDYLAGYDAVFSELGWNHSTTQQIALCRGAANMQRKAWGAMIVWTYDKPPYIESGPKILQEMLTAYSAGAKYVIVFNYPKYPETNQYGILTEEHFTAMKQFWDHVNASSRNISEKVDEKVAFVLPKDYGWGMRNKDDTIWGLWPADNIAPQIWENMNKLIQKYGLELDIVYGDARFDISKKYSKVYWWNATIN